MIRPVRFMDTGYWVALTNSADRLHERACQATAAWEGRLVTTQGVILEVANALSKLRWRDLAIALLADVYADPEIEVVPLTPELFARAITLYRERPDKEWSLTDCVSFLAGDRLRSGVHRRVRCDSSLASPQGGTTPHGLGVPDTLYSPPGSLHDPAAASSGETRDSDPRTGPGYSRSPVSGGITYGCTLTTSILGVPLAFGAEFWAKNKKEFHRILEERTDAEEPEVRVR